MRGDSFGVLYELLDSAPIIFQSVDKNGKFLFVNKAWEKLLGYTKDQVLKMSFSDIVAPKELPHCLKIFEAISKGKSDGHVETVFISSSGNEVFLEGSVSGHANTSGKGLCTMGFFYDVTSSLGSQEDRLILSKVAQFSPLSIILTDINGDIEYTNPRFTTLTGYLDTEVKGKNPRILKSGRTPDSVYRDLWKTVSSGKIWRGELINRKKDGTFYTASAVVSPVTDKGGFVTNFVSLQEDISNRKKSEEEMKLFSSLAVDRELRMIELKKEVNALLHELGKPRKYRIK